MLLSIVPLMACANVFTTQVERLAFGMGSGGPKLHPTSVQSIPPPLAATGATSHTLPAHELIRSRLVAPSGIRPSGTVDPPPPRSSPPHAIDLRRVALPSRTVPQLPLPRTVTMSSSSLPAGSVVLVVVVVDPGTLVVVAGAAVVDVVVPGTPRLASEQSGIDGASAFVARNEPT